MKATHLLIKYYRPPKDGPKCCICGDLCDGSLKGTDYFGDTFSDYRLMECVESEYICMPCAMSLKDVPGGVVRYIDGTIKTPKSDKRGLGWRFFSWLLVDGKDPIAATKAHCPEIVAWLKAPPVGSHFACIIADSGQKQLIYRIDAQKIGKKEDPFYVQFETERTRIDKHFWSLLYIANRLSCVVGKSKVLNEPSYVDLMAYMQEYGDESYTEYDAFKKAIKTPECRLAAWLCDNPKKKEK